MAAKLGFEAIQYVLKKALTKKGVKGIPTIFVIDKFGIIQLIRVGYTKEEEEEDFVSDLSEIIDKLLSDK